MRIMYKVFIVFFLAFTLFTNKNIVNAKSDNTPPKIYISSPSLTNVNEGGSLTYKLTYTDDVGIDKITLKKEDIVLRGFTATTSAVKNGNVVTLKLTNIKSTNSDSKSILVKAGTAVDKSGNLAPQAVSFSFYVNGSNKDTTSPNINISNPSSSTVKKGGQIEYYINYSDNVGISKITLNVNDITLVGFSATKSVQIISKNIAKVILSNINGTPGVKSIKIAAGTAIDTSSNKAPAANSLAFVIIENTPSIDVPQNPGTSTKPGNNNNSNNNINNNPPEIKEEEPKITDIKTSYEYNQNLKVFTTWLRIKKDDDRVRLYNVVSDNENVSYIIDYYNPENIDKANVKFTLTIPYKVIVKDEKKYSSVTHSNDIGTVIEFTIESIKANDSGRYIIDVTFEKNIILKTSDKISEKFYAKLKTSVSDKDKYSYIEQLYIDKSVTKKVYFTSTLLDLDPTNTVRLDDEITRAELAKILVDTGLVNKVSEDKFKTYSDYMKVRSYTKIAVSSIVDENIFDINNNMFNPNDPVIRDELFKILCNILVKKSDGLIKIEEPLYVIKNLTKTSSTDNKENYIMELVRQNILREDYKYDTLDEYITRREALYFINTLCFRVHMNNYPVYSVDNLNINGYDYIYNFTKDSNTSEYVYNYNDDLSINIMKK